MIVTIPADHEAALKACPFARQAVYGSRDVVVLQAEHDTPCDWCAGFAAGLAWAREGK